MNPATRLGIAGFGLIAICYGLARFAFGLFLPQIRDDLALSASLAGFISGGAFLAYCIAIVLSARLSERFGARAVAVSAAVVAALGMAGIAYAPSPISLALCVIVAGSSTGLASPPMAAAVAQCVAAARQDATNTWINAGTSAGVALCGPIALLLGSHWRAVYLGFALCALVWAAVAFICLPAGTRATTTPAAKPGTGYSANLIRLIGAAWLMGASSTALWSFGADIASSRLGWSGGGGGLLWMAIGAAGIVGAIAGWLVSRLGLNTVHRLFLLALAGSIACVGLPFTTPLLTLVGGGLFGAAYVTLTGVYLIWGTATLPERPATGLMVGFLTIAIGQTVGAPIFGVLMGHMGLNTAVLVFCGIGLLAGVFRFAPPAQRATDQAGLDNRLVASRS